VIRHMLFLLWLLPNVQVNRRAQRVRLNLGLGGGAIGDSTMGICTQSYAPRYSTKRDTQLQVSLLDMAWNVSGSSLLTERTRGARTGYRDPRRPQSL
jgi:hypothetical protein